MTIRDLSQLDATVQVLSDYDDVDYVRAPEQVAQNPNSCTGQYLKPVLERAWKLQGTAPAPVPEEPGRPAPAEEKASAQPPRKRKKADKK